MANSGNRCFANAVLQALLHAPPFLALLQDQLRADIGGGAWMGAHVQVQAHEHGHSHSHSHDHGSAEWAGQEHPLLRALLLLVDATSTDGTDGAAPAAVVDAVVDALLASTTAFHGHQQQDAEEFLTALLGQLGAELGRADAAPGTCEEWLEAGGQGRAVRTRQMSLAPAGTRSHPLTRLFGGTLRTSGGSRVVVEPFLVLPLAVTAATRSVEDALLLLARPERVPHAPGAPALRRQVLLGDLPALLVLQLKRFVLAPGGTRLLKLAHPLRAPARLLLPPACLHRAPPGGAAYALRAVVHHHGTALDAGHYTAQLATPAGFWAFDDDRPVRPEPVERVEHYSHTSYLLFYERVSGTEGVDGEGMMVKGGW